jgi:AcrR family transcriptional regulator
MKSKPSTERQPSLRVQHKRKQAKLDILQAAQGLLREGGVEAVTLESVSGALGMTKQALYHYFPSKKALDRSLITALIDDEVETAIAALESADSSGTALGVLIRAFYDHYINNLAAFRAVYCQSQFHGGPSVGMDKQTVHEEINPRTQHLFDSLEARLASRSMSKAKRVRLRRLAFVAWTSALGLVTMLSVADAVDDPLLHSDEELLGTLATVFDGAATVASR